MSFHAGFEKPGYKTIKPNPVGFSGLTRILLGKPGEYKGLKGKGKIRANISSNFGVSAYGRRNSKPRHCAYIRTILIVERIFSAYVRGYSKSRHCAYIRTFLIVARIFCAYVRGNSKSRRCAYIRTILIVERIHSAYVRGYSKSRQCAYMRTILIERESFLCVRTRKL